MSNIYVSVPQNSKRGQDESNPAVSYLSGQDGPCYLAHTRKISPKAI